MSRVQIWRLISSIQSLTAENSAPPTAPCTPNWRRDAGPRRRLTGPLRHATRNRRGRRARRRSPFAPSPQALLRASAAIDQVSRRTPMHLDSPESPSTILRTARGQHRRIPLHSPMRPEQLKSKGPARDRLISPREDSRKSLPLWRLPVHGHGTCAHHTALDGEVPLQTDRFTRRWPRLRRSGPHGDPCDAGRTRRNTSRTGRWRRS